MPKSLSLKKARAVPSKNQKPITQFFKNSTGTSQNHAVCDSQSTSSNKRKATVSNSPKSIEAFCHESEKIELRNVVSKKAKTDLNAFCDSLCNGTVTLEYKNEKCTNIKRNLFNSIVSEDNLVDFEDKEKLVENEILYDKQKEIKKLNRISKEGSPLFTVNNLDNALIKRNFFNSIVSEDNLVDLKDEVKLVENEILYDKQKEIENSNRNSKERSPLSTVNNLDNALIIDDDIEYDMFNLSPVEIGKSLQQTGSPCQPGKENVTNVENTGPTTPSKISSPRIVFKNGTLKTPSPTKAPLELRRSPRIGARNTNSQDKLENGYICSQEKAKIALDFESDDMNEMLDDIWEKSESERKDLDLNVMQRCEVIDIESYPSRIELKLKNSEKQVGICHVEGIWKDVPLSTGDIVSIIASKSSDNVFCVNNCTGLLVLRPDFLISSTSVVSGVFCRRKAVLQERFKGLDSSNTAMTIGILVHELVQRALTKKEHELEKLNTEAEILVKESISMLYDAGLSMVEVKDSMNAYIPPLSNFVKQYLFNKFNPNLNNSKKNMWNGHIDKVLDIEENICCSQLGLKGKIDATLQVTIHGRHEKKHQITPLELKSGKASGSVEHRGQLVLYGMMLALQRNANPAHDPDQSGLLLYLRDKIDLREVKCGYPERRDLIMLRNQLVQYLTPAPKQVDYDDIVDIEEAAHLLRQELPEPVHHQTACEKCPYLTLCSLHLWHTDGPKVTESHPLRKLRDTALGHLLNPHVSYFLHWAALCKLEERSQSMHAPLHALWTESPEKRAQRGICFPNLRIESVKANRDRYVHVFQRQEVPLQSDSKESKGPQEGDFAIVSTKDRPWIACGTISLIDSKEIQMLLERDLSKRQSSLCLFHIDTYESYATTVQNLTNLGVLMDDTDNSLRMRRLIIDLDEPDFEKKLPREVGRLGSRLMKGLNIEQQRAVLRSIAAKDYALLQGLPGTGKTQTISVLIQMLVALKQRVLVTAHTHSAVDNVLTRLPKTLKILRLGTSSRVATPIQSYCEHRLVESCATPEELAKLYESMEVVGVTCLGASHALLTKTKFDICIVDEATQVLQCTVLRPLFAAQKFVLVGDPAQLPPVVRSNVARRLGMEESLFARLSKVKAEVETTLSLQYRMNGTITEFANSVAYGGRLKCANEDVRKATMTISYENISNTVENSWLLIACNPELEHSVICLDTGPTSCADKKSNVNKDEALIVLAILQTLTLGKISPTQIGIIAPYREQVSLLRASVMRLYKNNPSPEVSTVDQFQGRDKSVIIFSCTKSSSEGSQERKIKEGEILNDPRRIAVSVTRAKYKFIIIGNLNILKRYEPFQKLVEACKPVLLPKGWQEQLHKEFEHIL